MTTQKPTRVTRHAPAASAPAPRSWVPWQLSCDEFRAPCRRSELRVGSPARGRLSLNIKKILYLKNSIKGHATDVKDDAVGVGSLECRFRFLVAAVGRLVADAQVDVVAVALPLDVARRATFLRETNTMTSC